MHARIRETANFFRPAAFQKHFPSDPLFEFHFVPFFSILSFPYLSACASPSLQTLTVLRVTAGVG